MMPAYDESYLNDAMDGMGEMLNCAVYDCGADADLFFYLFLSSGLAEQFERGNPRVVGGMSGVELAMEVFKRTTGQILLVEPVVQEERTPEYWAGRCLAYYQWRNGMRFREMVSCGLTVGNVCSMCLLHKTDIEWFVSGANTVVRANLNQRGTNLKRIRRARGLSQKQLSDASGVALRMIQLYEQRQNDINRAQASTLLELSRALGCLTEDLMEPVLWEPD